jgi:hypothetical protein
MNANDVKIGETFSKDGVTYRKTQDGVVRVGDERNVSAPAGEVILETQIIKG